MVATQVATLAVAVTGAQAQQLQTQTAQVAPVAIPPSQQLGRQDDSDPTRGAVFRQGLVEERNLTVMEREREGYDPLGVRLADQWLLFAGVEGGYEYNNNIYSTPNDKKNDSILALAPTLRLRSDMPLHQLNFDAGMISDHYMDHDDENTDSYFVSGNGRYDLSSTTFAFARAGTARQFEDRTSPNAVDGTEPTQYQRYDATAGIASTVLRLNYQVDATWRRLDYDDVNSTFGTLDNDARDIDIGIGSARVGWEWTQGFMTYVRGAYNGRSHFSTQPAFDRDSKGYEAAVGAVFSNPTVYTIDVSAGVLHQSFDDGRFDDVTEPTFAIDAAYNITPRTSLTGSLTRSLEETTLANSSSLLQTIASVGIEQEITYNLLGNVSVAKIWSDFQDVSRNDDVWVATAEVKYLLNRNFYIAPRFQLSDRSSDDPTAEFDQWRAMVVLGAQL
ncbi:MAG TPA: outer membrane beta-barrel protein [Alphaproteobacteria bacterium]